MSSDEYLTLKKQLSEALVGNVEDDCEENINALVDAFKISETEANKVLTDCNNDLRMAIKLLRVKALENGK